MILYPEYRGEPETWKRVKLPPVDEKFIKALSSIGTVASHPRFRLVDGSKERFFYEGDDSLPKGNYLSYTAMCNVRRQDGFIYSEGEKWLKVRRAADAPVCRLALPNFEYADFGIPRYMVEVYRDAREPGVEESGYIWAWTVDSRVRTVVAGEAAEISHYRHPGEVDLDLARRLLHIIELSTKESIKASAQRFMEAREKRSAEQKEIRRGIQAEAAESAVRNI